MVLAPLVGLHAAQGQVVQGALVLAAELDVLSVAPCFQIMLILLWTRFVVVCFLSLSLSLTLPLVANTM